MSTAPPDSDTAPGALTRAEAVATALVAALAALVLGSFLIDRLGLSFLPWPMLALATATAGATLAWLWPQAARDNEPLTTWAAVVVPVFGWLMWLARPSFLPLGTGPDLTHHLQLIRYLEEHWQMVHGRALQPWLAEMTVYTPGSHVTAALIGAWMGSNGLHAFQPLLSAVAALKLGLVAIVVRRMLPPDVPRQPIAIAAALSVFASQVFFLGSFLKFAFLAQVFAELFMLFCWWTVIAWQASHQTRWLVMFAIAAASLFLSWPILVGPPFFTLGLMLLFETTLPFKVRFRQALIAGLFPACIALWFMADRIRFLGIAATGGETAVPRMAAYGMPFIVLSTAGLVLALLRRRTRGTGFMAVAVLTQSAALWLAASSRDHNPYMAEKMFYGLLFVQAAGVGIAAGEVWSWIRGWRWQPVLAWAGATAVVIVTARSVAAAPKRMSIPIEPPITIPLEQAGEWARANLPHDCVEYLVRDDEASYWLHLAVLGNPRYSARSGDWDTYDFTKALVRWLTPNGLPWAIVELPAVPSDIRHELDIVQSFGTTAIARRRGPSSCAQ